MNSWQSPQDKKIVALNLLKAAQDKMKDADAVAKTAEHHRREANQVRSNLAVKCQKECRRLQRKFISYC